MMEEDSKIWMFLMEDDEIVEIHCEPADTSRTTRHVLGNIYTLEK